MPIDFARVAAQFLSDTGSTYDLSDQGVLPPALKKLAMPSPADPPPALLLGDMADLATRRTERPLVTAPMLALTAANARKTEELLERLAKVEAKL